MHYAYRALIVKSARPHASPGTSARLAAIVCAIIAAGASSSAAQVLTKSSTVTRTTSDPVVLTIKSVDDYATVIVNGTIRLTKTSSNLSQSVDITPYLVPGENIVQFEVSNTKQGWSYSWQMSADGKTMIDDSCAVWNTYPGCVNDDVTVGVVYRHSVTINVPGDVPPLVAMMTQPRNGTTAADLSEPMQWTSVPNAEAYYLYVGSTIGYWDLVNSGNIQQTFYGATNLPAGRTLYARLWTRAGGFWRYTDSTFSAPGPLVATMTYPVNGSTNADLGRPVQWTSVPNAQAYYLYLGSTQGANDLVNSGEIQQTSYAIPRAVPANQTLYARLWTKAGGVWRYSDSSFTALPVAQSTVTADTVVPNWGTGANRSFVLHYSDTGGVTDLSTASVWFNATVGSSAANSCLVSYDRAANALSLLNDAGDNWTRATVGSSGMLHNSQCFIALDSGTTATSSGNILTLGLTMTFAPAFSGTKNIYMSAASAAVSSGWQTRGTWTVPAASTSLVLTGDPGSGQEGVFFTGEDGSLTAVVNSDNGVSLWFRTQTFDQSWSLDFAAPYDQFLTVGTYTGAAGFPLQALNQPGLSVSRNGARCTPLRGSFEVKEIKYGLAGAVTAFWATFEQQCNGSAPATRGEIRINATAQVAATLTFPVHFSTGADLSQPFRWTSVPNAQAYYLYVGTSRGAKDLVNTGAIQQTSYVVSGSLPPNQPLYARIWTKVGGVWLYTDSSFTALPVSQSTVTADTVVPNWGTGARQTFALQYLDTTGVTDLAAASVWFDAAGALSSAAHSCLVSYDRAANALSLLNDAGNSWMRATVGSSGTLHNSQCFITLGSSTTATSSGNVLTLNLAMAFTPAFNGTKNIYMSAANAAASSGWQTRGSWSVPAASTSLVVTGDPGDWIAGKDAAFFTPDDGYLTAALNYDNGVSVSFRTPTYSHWWNLEFAAPNGQLLTVGTYTGAARFSFQASNQPGLSVSGDGRSCNAPTGSFEVKEITYGLAGAVTSFWATFEQYCDGSGPAARGEIRFNATVPFAATLTFPVHFSTNADLSQPFRWTSVPNAQAYYLYVGSTRGAKNLVNTGEIQQTSYVIAGSLPANQTLYARLWTKIGGVWLYNDSSFTALPQAQSTVTTETVFPNWGTGIRQAFVFQYSDTAGATDLSTASVWFSPTFTSNAARSCLVSYDRAANALSLLSDAGNAWTRATIGSSGTLHNSQCFVTLGTSTTATMSGNILTLSLAMTFTPAFNGTKNIYMSAANAAVGSGWQARGAWTVPPATTSFVLMGDQGDFVTGGQAQLFTSDDGFITASLNYANGVSVAFRTLTYDHWWDVDFAAPNKEFLTVGTYNGAARFPFQASNQPGLDVGGDGRGCNTLTGSFEVKEIKYGSTGEVTSFWATFEQHCEGRGPAARGEVRFNATVQLAAALRFPTHFSTDVDLSQPLQWASVPNAQAYYLYVGTSRGAKDLLNTGELQQTSFAVIGSLPANQPLYARLWTKVGGVWRYVDSTFTAMPIAQSPVTAETVRPDWGTGTRQTFALQYSDSAGATDLSTAWAWFNSTLASNPANSCLMSYDRAANTLSLLNDAGDNWLRAALGSSGTLHNSQCFITLGSSTTATSSGNVLTLSLAMTFTPAFNGTKNIYMAAANAAVSSGWHTRGSWTVPAPTTAFVLVGDQGDYISGGEAMFFTPVDGVFTASANYGNGVSLTFRTPTYAHWWSLDFAAPNNQVLTVGKYTGAARFPFQASNQPGLDVSGDGRGCNTLKGSFEVKEIKYGSAGAVTSFWATYEQHCEGSVPAAKGEIRYNVTAPN